jgi:HSP20 family molecular chaperone IbpA
MDFLSRRNPVSVERPLIAAKGGIIRMTTLATQNSSTPAAMRGYDFFDPFKSLFSGMWPLGNAGIEVQSTETGYVVEVPVPGFAPEQIDVTYKDGTIAISGNSERRTLMRSFAVPEEIDPDAINATVEHGLLTLRLNRLPHAQPRKIKVSSN